MYTSILRVCVCCLSCTYLYTDKFSKRKYLCAEKCQTAFAPLKSSVEGLQQQQPHQQHPCCACFIQYAYADAHI